MGIEVEKVFCVLDGALASGFTLSAKGVKILQEKDYLFLHEGDVLALSKHQPPVGEKSAYLETQLFRTRVKVGRSEEFFSAITRLTK